MTRRMPWTLLLLWAATISASAQITTLASFNKADGWDPGWPASPFVQGLDGNFYGTTASGGANDTGTVFAMSPAGEIVTLYSFCAQPNCADGGVPNAGLIQAADGTLYGTTNGGGANHFGAIFKITAGQYTTFYSFCSQPGCPDGASPSAGVMQGADGNFYGTTAAGGAFGAGSIFKITPAGVLTTLASFDGTNGRNPAFGSLIQATDGNFYGTTLTGGNTTTTSCVSSQGCGTVFRMTPHGDLTTIHSFCDQTFDCSDGYEPYGGLVQGNDGSLFGTTALGGFNGYGTVFKLSIGGLLSTLYNFEYDPDGAYPEAALIQGTDGNFYGTTPNGGTNGVAGTVFQISPIGEFGTLYDFCSKPGCADGTGPFESVMQATNGEIYGTTFAGGSSKNCSGGCGTVFSLSVGLAPFVEASPNSGKIGQIVNILGNNLTGTTQVFFNDAPAEFKVVSSTLIKAQVPSGAATGVLNVVTPSGTLASYLSFQVLP
jgi:uncharacterized repeat protein (TIGR03803 family)